MASPFDPLHLNYAVNLTGTPSGFSGGFVFYVVSGSKTASTFQIEVVNSATGVAVNLNTGGLAFVMDFVVYGVQ
jgi:hypothetical protein